MSNESAFAKPAKPRDEGGADHPAGRARDEDPRRVGSSLLDRRDAAGRSHDERRAEPRPAAAIAEGPKVASRAWPEVGVRRSRRGALVLAELGRHLVRGHHVCARQPAPNLGCDRPLVRRVPEREEQADRDRLRVELGQRRQVERLDDAVGADPLPHADAALERHERRRVLLAGAVQVRPRLPAQME